MIDMLKAEYEALDDSKKRQFLERATAKGYSTLTEEVLWDNLEKLDKYIGDNAAANGVEHFEGGSIVYDYIRQRFQDFMKTHGKDMNDGFRMFLEVLLEECESENLDFTDTDSMNKRLEELVVSMFMLIANKKKEHGKSKLGEFLNDFSWKDFPDDVKKSRFPKENRLQKRKRKILSDGVDKKHLEWSCACDTYIYTAIALYYTKICRNEEDVVGMKLAAPEALRDIVSQKVGEFLSDKIKSDISIQINRASARFSEKKVHVHLEVDGEMDRGELLRLIGEIIGGALKKHKKEE